MQTWGHQQIISTSEGNLIETVKSLKDEAISSIDSILNQHTIPLIDKLKDEINQQIQDLLKDKLTNYKIPKVWISVDSLPRNSQGKINRQLVYKIAFEYIELSAKSSETSPRPADTPLLIKERGRRAKTS